MGAKSSSSSKPYAFSVDAPQARDAYVNILRNAISSGLGEAAKPFEMPREEQYARQRRNWWEQGATPLLERGREEILSTARMTGASPESASHNIARMYVDMGKNFSNFAEALGLEQIRAEEDTERARWAQLVELLGLGKPSGALSTASQRQSPIGDIMDIASLGGLMYLGTRK